VKEKDDGCVRECVKNPNFTLIYTPSDPYYKKKMYFLDS
jgi:hypothetical protein